MDELYELLRACQVVVYGTLGVVALLQWRRRDTPTTAWLAATFGTLGTVIIASRIVPTDPPNSVLRKLLVVGLILFPYFLYRFTRTFVVRSRPLFWLATTVTGALIAVTFLVQIPAPDAPRPPGFRLFVYVLALQWVALNGLVVARLWGGVRGQPRFAAIRMSLLGGAALAMAAALVIAAFAPQSVEVGIGDIAGQLLSLSSGPLFLVAFWPPSIVRAWWRQRMSREILPVELALMEATTPGEVGTILLPQASELMGGCGTVLAMDDGTVLGRYALSEDDAAALAARARSKDASGDLLAVPLQNGVLAVATSAFVPFFGRDETELLARIALLADLALVRTVVLERERAVAEQLREAQKLAHIGSWVWDLATDSVTWSDEFWNIFGFRKGVDQPARDRVMARIHPDDRDRVLIETEAALTDRQLPQSTEYRIVLPSGEEKVIQARGRIELDDGQPVRMVGTAQDITARKREEQVRDQFIANAAHELRTPLTALLGFMQLLTDGDNLTPERAAAARAAVRRASDRMGNLVNNLLDLAKLRQGTTKVTLEPVDVSELLDDVLKTAPPPDGHEVHVDAGGAFALTNRQSLEQVLVNLLSNSYRYGGSRVFVSVTSTGEAVRVSVIDDGSGVEAELVPHLFEPFTRGPESSRVGGSGLGLAIAAANAEAVGGRLSYERADSGGACFTVEVQAAR